MMSCEKICGQTSGLIQQIIQPFCVTATPPCSTYSRARHFYQVSPGPRPFRSRQFPLGFPWLSASKKQKADDGTKLADRAWDLLFLGPRDCSISWGDLRQVFLHRFGKCNSFKRSFHSVVR